MKKILVLATALLLLAPFANAQLKPSADVKKTVEKARADAENPKKAGKAATWIKLGKCYLNAYSDATGSVQLGQNEMDAALFINAKPVADPEMVEINGNQYVKYTYSTVNLYYQDGHIAAIEPTDIAYPDALVLAGESYAKAYELDPKKAKDITEALRLVQNRLNQSASSLYAIGQNASASVDFEAAFDVTVATNLFEKPDFDALYNAILVSTFDSNFERVRDLSVKALAAGYEGNGDVYAKLGDAYGQLGDVAHQKEALETGFAKYPENEAILFSLINYATQNGEPNDYVFSLLHKAQELDPKNASLWYVEGNIYLNNKEFENALAKYHAAQEIDPNYLYSFYQEGVLWATWHDALQDESNTVAPNNYRLLDEYDARMAECLKNSIKPFEHCFENGDDSFKLACSQYLTQICFILRNKGQEYVEKSEFYKAYAESHQ